MVDREEFDEFLRKRAESAGVTRFSGTFDKITRQDGETIVEFLNHKNENKQKIRAKIIIGADGARGLRRIINLIKEELSTNLGLVGLTDINEVDKKIIAEKIFKDINY